jgi:hypothetical protein
MHLQEKSDDRVMTHRLDNDFSDLLQWLTPKHLASVGVIRHLLPQHAHVIWILEWQQIQ